MLFYLSSVWVFACLLLLSITRTVYFFLNYYSCANNLILFLCIHVNYLIMHFVQIFPVFLFIDLDFELGSLYTQQSRAGIVGMCHTRLDNFSVGGYLFSFVSFFPLNFVNISFRLLLAFFYSLKATFWVEKFLILMKSSLPWFSFMNYDFCFISKKLCPNLRYNIFCLCFCC